MFFNIYTKDQLTPDKTEHFLYTDDVAIAAHGRISQWLKCIVTNVNPLQNKLFKIEPSHTYIEHINRPKYLGEILDRSLTFKSHCQKTRQKIPTKNQLLRVTGTNQRVIRSTA